MKKITPKKEDKLDKILKVLTEIREIVKTPEQRQIDAFKCPPIYQYPQGTNPLYRCSRCGMELSGNIMHACC